MTDTQPGDASKRRAPFADPTDRVLQIVLEETTDTQADERRLRRIRAVLERHPGTLVVEFVMKKRDASSASLPSGTVDESAVPAVLPEVRSLLGVLGSADLRERTRSISHSSEVVGRTSSASIRLASIAVVERLAREIADTSEVRSEVAIAETTLTLMAEMRALVSFNDRTPPTEAWLRLLRTMWEQLVPGSGRLAALGAALKGVWDAYQDERETEL